MRRHARNYIVNWIPILDSDWIQVHNFLILSGFESFCFLHEWRIQITHPYPFVIFNIISLVKSWFHSKRPYWTCSLIAWWSFRIKCILGRKLKLILFSDVTYQWQVWKLLFRCYKFCSVQQINQSSICDSFSIRRYLTAYVLIEWCCQAAHYMRIKI